MLHLLSNNFVLSLLLGFSVLCFVFFSNRKKEENEKLNGVFYMRLFAFVFFVVLSVLYFKTKDLSLPSLKANQNGFPQMGGSPPLSSVHSSSPSLDLGLEKINLGDPNF